MMMSFSEVPLRLLRSSRKNASPVRMMRAWWRLTESWGTTTSQSLFRPKVHLAAVVPNMPYFEYPIAFPDSPIVSDLLDPPLVPDADGLIAVPQRPGLGFRLNEDVVREFRVEPH